MMVNIVKRADPAVLDGSYRLPVTDGSGRDRKVPKQALDLLRRKPDIRSATGAWSMPGANSPSRNHDPERRSGKLALAYQRSLGTRHRAGRSAPSTIQYQNRTIAFTSTWW